MEHRLRRPGYAKRYSPKRQNYGVGTLKRILAVLLVLASATPGCKTMPAPLESNSVNFSFPYVASPTRTAQIQGSLDKITVGMTVDATVRILGEPDEVLPLYEPKGLEPEQIGTTRWYYVRIDSPEERTAAQLMRLSADHENLITAIDHWGISAQLE